MTKTEKTSLLILICKAYSNFVAFLFGGALNKEAGMLRLTGSSDIDWDDFVRQHRHKQELLQGFCAEKFHKTALSRKWADVRTKNPKIREHLMQQLSGQLEDVKDVDARQIVDIFRLSDIVKLKNPNAPTRVRRGGHARRDRIRSSGEDLVEDSMSLVGVPTESLKELSEDLDGLRRTLEIENGSYELHAMVDIDVSHPSFDHDSKLAEKVRENAEPLETIETSVWEEMEIESHPVSPCPDSELMPAAMLLTTKLGKSANLVLIPSLEGKNLEHEGLDHNKVFPVNGSMIESSLVSNVLTVLPTTTLSVEGICPAGVLSPLADEAQAAISGVRTDTGPAKHMMTVEEWLCAVQERQCCPELIHSFARMYVTFAREVLFNEEVSRIQSDAELLAWEKVEVEKVMAKIMLIQHTQQDAGEAADFCCGAQEHEGWRLEIKHEVMVLAGALVPIAYVKFLVLWREDRARLLLVDHLCRNRASPKGVGPVGRVGSVVVEQLVARDTPCRVPSCPR